MSEGRLSSAQNDLWVSSVLSHTDTVFGMRSSRRNASPKRRLIAALGSATILAALLIPVSAGPAAACAESNVPGQVILQGFTRGAENATSSNFYMVGENQPEAAVTIAVYPAACVQGGATARATYVTQNLVAAAPSDYTSMGPTQTLQMCDDHHHDQYCGDNSPPPNRTVEVPIGQDGTIEAPVEPFLFDLTAGTNGGVGEPGEAPVYIVDNDGTVRFSLEPTRQGTDAVQYTRPEGYFIEIPVFRAGSAGSATSVPYSIQSTGATDAVPGVDYVVPAPQQVNFGADQRFSFIRVQVLEDYTLDGDKKIEFTLGGDSPAPTDSTSLILDDSGVVIRDTTPPVTKFHHPKQGLVYKKGDYRLRSMHVYDMGGSDATRVQMALRKRTEANRCSWFKQGEWKWGGCDTPIWLSMKKFPYQFKGRDLYHRSFPKLKPTEGTWVKDYQGRSRGWDSADNDEDTFTKGRNFNTFFVSKVRQ